MTRGWRIAILLLVLASFAAMGFRLATGRADLLGLPVAAVGALALVVAWGALLAAFLAGRRRR